VSSARKPNIKSRGSGSTRRPKSLEESKEHAFRELRRHSRKEAFAKYTPAEENRGKKREKVAQNE